LILIDQNNGERSSDFADSMFHPNGKLVNPPPPTCQHQTPNSLPFKDYLTFPTHYITRSSSSFSRAEAALFLELGFLGAILDKITGLLAEKAYFQSTISSSIARLENLIYPAHRGPEYKLPSKQTGRDLSSLRINSFLTL
jgi:hypothetical protein